MRKMLGFAMVGAAGVVIGAVGFTALPLRAAPPQADTSPWVPAGATTSVDLSGKPRAAAWFIKGGKAIVVCHSQGDQAAPLCTPMNLLP